MATKLSVAPASAVRYTCDSAISKDGTTIGYRQLGSGPGIVIVHGAMESSQNHMQLAEALADAFTIYALDRRGRGLSGPYGTQYSFQEDVDDLDAVLTKTGARYVFGVSSGAIMSLQAALSLPSISKLALYEPAFFVDDNATPTALVRRFDREMAEGRVAAAMITGMKGAQMGPPLLNAAPYWLLEPLTQMMMNSEEKRPSEYLSMKALAPTLHYDFQLVAEMSGPVERFRALQTETLLLGGSKSPAYLKAALDALERTLPHAQRIEFPGLNHAASGNTDRGGQPEVVAQALRGFFVQANSR